MAESSYLREQAVVYETEAEHALPPEEAAVWLREIAALGLPAKPRILDFGAGTNSLLSVLRAAGYDAVGLESSSAMMEQGLFAR